MFSYLLAALIDSLVPTTMERRRRDRTWRESILTATTDALRAATLDERGLLNRSATSRNPSSSTSRNPSSSTSRNPASSTSRNPSSSTSTNPSTSTSRNPTTSTSRNPSSSTSRNHASSTSRNHSSSTSNSANQPFKFLSGNYEQIRVRENYSVVEATEPTSNFVYFARSLTHGRAFGVSVTKVLDEKDPDFSFILGFTTCSPAALHNDERHLTEQCSPNGCGGQSQQLKIFKANQIGAKVTVERQVDGEICFAIGSSLPLRIQFDRNTCAINLVKEKLLTPYIQLSGNALALSIQTTNIRKLNIKSAVAVRGFPLGTTTAFGPPVRKKILPVTAGGQAHQVFVALSDVDTKFMELNYPENDVKLSVNRMAILRKNELGERFVFYLDKLLRFNAHVTVQVTKVYSNGTYASDFEFGLTTASSDRITMNEHEFYADSTSVRSASHCVKICDDAKVNDKFTFTRTGNGVLEIRKNDVLQRVSKMDRKFMRTENLLPFIVLNGQVSGIISINDKSMEFRQMYEWPPVEFKTKSNVELTNTTLLTWNRNNKAGLIVNSKPFDSALKFIIREVRTSTDDHSMTFGLINSASIGFKTPREISTCLDFEHENLIKSPALGLKFSLYKTPYGKVTLKYDNSGHNDPTTTLFMVDSSLCYYPVIILNGSVVAIELLPNPTKTTVKCVTSKSTGATPKPVHPPPPPQNNDCKICMDRPINSVFVPCGHRFACYDCGKEWMQSGNVTYGSWDNCPVCRKTIQTIVQTFD